MVRRLLWRVKVRWPNLGRWLLVGFGLLVGGLGGWWFTLPDWQRDDLLFRAKWWVGQLAEAAEPEVRPYRYFANCNDARLAGYGSIRSDEPSYRPELDEDGDGIACEPWRRRRMGFGIGPNR